ncbi:ROK family transcriptional regulator [Thermoanaerobacterium sp. RBIITD]|uniref:ROK family transcriptional regulator n=1 Tax=Thermoanaerobacterium sp. RBIITD TaxID=1550240 RepID=UPI000BB9919B|nr:ROK family transcriptional regulator [Thermoanaerobacterium sp. RBIITD]SNX54989.1 Sugar kinase of the NBD/HSP70 family, may contain an N-terminal HTH domain [Thermoanaerobacterium sp. RBIITD]
MRHKSNLKELKEKNKKCILKLLLNDGPLSRTEISQRVGLSMTAVSDLVEELLNEKILIESGMGSSTGGRRPVMLEINTKNGYVATLKILRDKLICILFDFNLNKGIEKEIEFDYFDLPFLQKIIKELIKDLERDLKVEKRKIYGIGICINSDLKEFNLKGVLSTSISSGYLTLSQALSYELGIPVIEENEIYLKSMAEYLSLGINNNLAYIDINNEIQSSVILNGRRISENINIGHMIIDRYGPECSEGHRGCLNTLVTIKAILKKAITLSKDQSNVIDGTNSSFVNIDSIYKFFKSDAIDRIINDISDSLKITIINLKNLLNIKTFVLDGKIIKLFDISSRIQNSFDDIIIKCCSVGKDDILKATAKLTLNKIINEQEV